MFFLIQRYRYVLLLIAALMILFGVFRLVRKRSETLTKAAIFGYHIGKGKKWLNFLILLVLILNCFMIPLEMRQSGKTEISLNYAKASQGLNPNGTRFNPAGILSEEILEKAIRKGAFSDLTASDLQKVLSVSPKVQGNSYDENGYFISTQFVLSYQANEKTAPLDGETLLALTAEAYKEWFIQEYSENVSALDMDFSDIGSEDYLDICEQLRKKADLIKLYMSGMANEDPAFQSSSVGETFQSVSSQAKNVSDVMAEKLEAYLLENGVSKASSLYMSRLSFENMFQYFDSVKAHRSNQNNLAAISMYENDMARIVLVPTYDIDFQFYMSQTRIGIDDFAKTAEAFANDKTKINGEISRNNHVLNQLSSLAYAGGEDEKAEELVLQIEKELSHLAEKARALVEEYSADQANQYITITAFPWENRFSSVLFNILAFTFLFALSVHFVSFSLTAGRHSGRKDAENAVQEKKK